MNENPLGKKTQYISTYDKTLLYPILRNINREKNGIDEKLFYGSDVWNCYEFSFLDLSGKPKVYVLQIIYDCHSEFMVESKSLKLYLGSFAMERFSNIKYVIDVIKNDLKEVLKTSIVIIYKNCFNKFEYKKIKQKYLIDNINTEITEYKLNSNLLETKKLKHKKNIERYSNLLKSNCPITGQPDYATVYIKYRSDIVIKDNSLLKYIISFREHWDYHENCCEKMFIDIYNLIKPKYLIIKCFFTRRGGIDINPIRFISINKKIDLDFHYWRQ
ncbi:MAG TPA: NADPH-dependent 7-cyano-7-deazaguanine reductase QueF [Spirochaetota bacterium]|nr:NADPH-dependent 7-cyano-7-deazaguanine reductase QueF [Spirochaetota bacterium]